MGKEMGSVVAESIFKNSLTVSNFGSPIAQQHFENRYHKSRFHLKSVDSNDVLRVDLNQNFLTFGLEKTKRIIEDFSFAEKRASANEVVRN